MPSSNAFFLRSMNRRLALGHRLAGRGVLAQPLRFLGRVDDDARLFRCLPEDQPVGEAAVALQKARNISWLTSWRMLGSALATPACLSRATSPSLRLPTARRRWSRRRLVAGAEHGLPRLLGR